MMISGKFNVFSSVVRSCGRVLGSVASISQQTKIASRSLCVTPYSNKGIFNSTRFQHQQRAFCASAGTNASLVDVLKEEIEAETELARKNLGGREAPTIPGFQINTDDAEVKLTKSHGNESVTVLFNVNNSVDTDDLEEGMGESAEDSSSLMASRPAFIVEIEKGSQKLAFECQLAPPHNEEEQANEEQDVFQIDQLYLYSGPEEVKESVYSATTSVMDVQLYEHLMKYLEERGIDRNFANSFIQFSTHYEHAQYVAMLRKMKDFMTA